MSRVTKNTGRIISQQVLNQIKKSMAPDPAGQFIINRNPRNLEFLRIADKPKGYRLDNPGRCFWNQLTLTSSGKYATAQMIHFEKKEPIIEASTDEWAIKKQLFKPNDISAFANLGRIFAQRCLESGFFEMRSYIKGPEGGKISAFLQELRNAGLVLNESTVLKPKSGYSRYVGRPAKPY